MSPELPARGARYGFVDLLRGLALVVMIETHVVNAYLPDELRRGGFYFWLSFVNGLVAPCFLFASGFSVTLQASRYWEDWLRLRAPFWRQVRRLGFILLVAYALHLQHYRLSAYLAERDPEIWKRTLQVDVLQCIIASLLVAHALMFLVRRRERLIPAAATAALVVSLATPWIWAQDFAERLPLSVALYLNPHTISLFPVFPWMAFLLAGCAVGGVFQRSVARGSGPGFMRSLPLCALMLIGMGLLGRWVPVSLPGCRDFYLTSPLYVAVRLGCVLLILAVLHRWERIGRWLPSPVRLAGQESLLVYGLHLVVIYGVLRGRFLGPRLGLQADYAVCFLLSALLIAIMLWIAALWQRLKRGHPREVQRVQTVVVAAAVLAFLLT